LSYAFAFLCTGVAAALRIAIDPYVVGVQYITFFPAVMITTLISGFGAGVFSVVLSAAAVDVFVLSPHLSFYVERTAVLDLLLFILLTLSNVFFIAVMRLAAERYREQGMALRESEARLQVVVAELQHRTRNLISVVGTLAKGTLRTSKTFDDFNTTFQDRLEEVLGRAQGLLFRTHEGGRVTFDELIDTELAAQSVRVEENRPTSRPLAWSRAA
jgi:K+-sensing histidine kinase KdpD